MRPKIHITQYEHKKMSEKEDEIRMILELTSEKIDYVETPQRKRSEVEDSDIEIRYKISVPAQKKFYRVLLILKDDEKVELKEIVIDEL